MIIQLRHDTAANWTSEDPTLEEGEVGCETDTGRLKVGDASTAWTSLAYAGSGITLIEGLTDVDSMAPTDNDVLTWDSGTSKWSSSAAGAGTGFTPNVQPEGYDIGVDGSDNIFFSGQGATYIYSGTNTVIVSSATASAGDLSDLTINADKDWDSKGIYNASFLSGTTISGGHVKGTWAGDEIDAAFIGSHSNTEHDNNYYYQESELTALLDDNYAPSTLTDTRHTEYTNHSGNTDIHFTVASIDDNYAPSAASHGLYAPSAATKTHIDDATLHFTVESIDDNYAPSAAAHGLYAPSALTATHYTEYTNHSGNTSNPHEVAWSDVSAAGIIDLDDNYAPSTASHGLYAPSALTSTHYTEYTNHSGNTSNPHEVTWSDVSTAAIIDLDDNYAPTGAGLIGSGQITATTPVNIDTANAYVIGEAAVLSIDADSVTQAMLKSGSEYYQAYESGQIALYSETYGDEASLTAVLDDDYYPSSLGETHQYLSGLTDTGFSSPASGAHLRFNGTDWLPISSARAGYFATKPTADIHQGEIIRVSGNTADKKTYVYLSINNDANTWEWAQIAIST